MIEDVEKIRRKIAKWQDKLKSYQEACAHADTMRINKSNTGNYDPSCDSYWCECKCNLCGKEWWEDQ